MTIVDIKKITGELNQSGIPLEVFTSLQLNKNHWIVRPSVDYFDEKISEFRETDIIAYKRAYNLIGITLIIECKKSADKPWILVKQDRPNVLLSENLNIAIIRDDFVKYEVLEKSMKYHHYSHVSKCAYSFVAFTKDNEKKREQIFHAKTQVISSLNKMISKEKDFLKFKNETRIKQFFYPVIVFDGILYCAEIKDDTIEITEANHLILSLDRELPSRRPLDFGERGTYHQDFKPYMIDIVKKEFLNEYFEMVYKYFKDADEFLYSCFKE